jgi:uncharacterized protein
MINEQRLLSIIRPQFMLDWAGIHGPRHWARVRQNALRLAAVTGASLEVLELFALLHDSRRLSEGHDPGHGPRAAEFAQSLAGVAFRIDSASLDLLVVACRQHSDGVMAGDMTVLTCWDADRLDLGRVGIKPREQYLCTPAARDPIVLEWAYRRSIGKSG